MATAVSWCVVCGRRFRPNRYNPEHQQCCSLPDCVRECKRRRQRKWYERKCRDDPSFAEAARKRCAAANRRRRSRIRAAAAVPVAASSPVAAPAETTPQALFEVLSGFLSQLTDTTDPAELSASMRDYRERGRRVALNTAVSAGSG
jgi:hypothetical protein